MLNACVCRAPDPADSRLACSSSTCRSAGQLACVWMRLDASRLLLLCSCVAVCELACERPIPPPACKLTASALVSRPSWPSMCSAPIVASQLLLVDEVLRAGMNMRRGAA